MGLTHIGSSSMDGVLKLFHFIVFFCFLFFESCVIFFQIYFIHFCLIFFSWLFLFISSLSHYFFPQIYFFLFCTHNFVFIAEVDFELNLCASFDHSYFIFFYKKGDIYLRT